MKIQILLILFVLCAALAFGHSGDPVYVRVVEADPISRTYNFSCRMDPENNFLRDWYIRPDDGDTADDQNEAEILDKTGKTITYAFEENSFYHVGCLVYDDINAILYRGDLHIDLGNETWNPAIQHIGGSNLTTQLFCNYETSPYAVNWEVIDASTGIRSNIGSSNPLTFSVPDAGLFDFICHETQNSVTKSTGLPVEFFHQGDPYYPDNQGVPDGIEDSWIRVDPSENASSICGNSNLESGEECDDGNTMNGDGCSSSCLVESAQQCYSTLQTVPVNCDGGAITSDTFDGGRHIICTGSGKSLSIDAWPKPSGNNQQSFEMYKKSQTGSGVEICLGTACISNNGFASLALPYCTSGSPPPPVTPVCGNSNLENGEQCDDGNFVNGDGCSFLCQIESAQQCYSTLETVPVNCNGGAITSDTFDGGRHVTCTGSGKSLSVAAWPKPSGNNQEYFEIYKQSQTGYGVEICLGTACISNNGYASLALPYCTSGSPPPPVTPVCGNSNLESGEECDDGNAINGDGCSSSCQVESTQQCYNAIQNIPATCTGGTITSDIFDGGRHIGCSNSEASLEISAWDKPTGNDPNYFEMYKKSNAGSGIGICIGSTCISNGGYAKSSYYPICISGGIDTESFDPPAWLSHTDVFDVSPSFFHFEIWETNYTSMIVATDWEIFDEAMTEKVWHELEALSTDRFHTHAPQGVFIGSLSEETSLEYNTTYNARARFKNIDGSYSNWSSIRVFTTLVMQNASEDAAEWTAKPGFRVDIFASGLDYPVQIDAAPIGMYDSLPDNQEPYLYVTELYGKIKVIHKDGSVSTYAENILNYDPFGSITGGGQMGVVGIYADEETGDLFVGMTYLDANESIKNKIVKFISTNDGNSYSSSQIIIQGLPSSSSHQIEDITKGPDGKLYVGLGDALTPSYSQSDSILAGKIIRMNTDGSNIEIYAKGFRNPFGQAWRPGYNVLYSTDNAPDQKDRIVKVIQGGNYGWGLNDNFATWDSKSLFYTDVSPVDVEFNPGNKGFPSGLTGNMYVAVAGPVYQQGPTNSKHILEFNFAANGSILSSSELVKYTGNGFGTPIGMSFAPDGLYFTDIYGYAGANGYGSDGQVLRVSPGVPSNDTTQTGNLSANIYISLWYPKLIGNNVEYQFTCHPVYGTGQYSFDWKFGDGSYHYGDQYNEDGDGKHIHTYPYANETFKVECRINDKTTGKSATISMDVNPGDYISEQQ